MPEKALEFVHVGVEFFGRPVLEDVCVSVPEGGLTVFVGPNGAGKTTLLLSIMGEVPHTGTIRFAGDVDGRMGYVPQHLAAQSATPITCGEFLALNATRRPVFLGLGRRENDVVDGALEKVGLSGARRRPMGELSGGQTRRVLLASALLQKPRLLLLDEPAAGVDMSGERLFWDVLDELRVKEGLSIVMVSHNLSLAAHFATHVVCVSHGRCQEGTPQDVFTAGNLMEVFGVPIHLYPEQCAVPHERCPGCGAFARAGQEHPCFRPLPMADRMDNGMAGAGDSCAEGRS